MKKIAIIGAGQLGSRHLQGIAQSTIAIDIEVVEPFEASREMAKSRFYEIKNRNMVNSIEFYDTIEKLSCNLDLVIIATGADVRFRVVSELLEKKNVENLILEKVLFQQIDEYKKTEKLLNDTNTKCWVNHPRRMFPVYQKLKKMLQKSKEISFNIQGGDWGLGCNGLHFIDLFSYLVDSTNVTLDTKTLNNKIYNSKREGFVEFNGLLCGKIDNHIFSLYSNSEYVPFIFTLSSDKLVATIYEEEGKIEFKRKEKEWEVELLEKKIIYYQSELSNKILIDIVAYGNSTLPTYQEAMELHIPFISALLGHMNHIDGQNHKICPIT